MAVRRATGEITGGREIAGFVSLVLGLVLLLGLLSYDPDDISLLARPPNQPPRNLFGAAGAWTSFVLLMGLGAAAWALAIGSLAWAGLALFVRTERVARRWVWLSVVAVSLAVLFDLHPPISEEWLHRVNVPGPGGIVGLWLARNVFVRWFGEVGSVLLTGTFTVLGLGMFFRVSPYRLGNAVVRIVRSGWARLLEARRARMDRLTRIVEEEKELARKRRSLEEALKQHQAIPERSTPSPVLSPAPETPGSEPTTHFRSNARGEAVAVAGSSSGPASSSSAATTAGTTPPMVEPMPPRRRPPAPAAAVSTPASTAPASAAANCPPASAPAAVPAAQTPAPAPAPAAAEAGRPRTWVLPRTEILDAIPPESQRVIADDLQRAQQTLVDTLADFGIEVRITNVETGPVVTRYELLPAPGVRVEKIASLSNNIALSLKAESVRVQAPVPGKGVVGIEVPNPKTSVVYLREVLESETWAQTRAALPLALGKDVGGRVLVADLAEMPHLLIAGATGSGKTVCMNSLLCGLLMSRTPDEVRFLLVDPKIVEFAAYRDIPHLVVPVITDPKKVAHGLRWAIQEMESRYKLFARVGVRNIRAFNSRPIVRQPDLFDAHAERGASPVPERLPYIVIVVDELADLMLVAQAEIENQIARLAQLSRAVGIHMVLATQRPSVDVITGTIKANFPARIAFQVAQKNDSRTILDANGADKLLGRGDMLFLPPGVGRLIRAQGCLVTDRDVQAVVEYWRQQGSPEYESSVMERLEKKSADIPEMEEDEEMIQQAIEIIRQTRRASTSSLQRRLRIGYTRAARIMDLLEERGIVGPAQGSDPREILIDLDGEIPSRGPSGATEPADAPNWEDAERT